MHLSIPDRTSDSGVLIDKFLRKEIKLDAIAVHLLFSANRQACRYAGRLDTGVGVLCHNHCNCISHSEKRDTRVSRRFSRHDFAPSLLTGFLCN